MSSLHSRPLGFTLTELMVVVAVAGILATIAVPSFQAMTQNQQVKNASFELFTGLSLARSEAIKRNGNVTVNPVVSSNWGRGWTITSAGGESIFSQSALNGVSITSAVSSVVYARTGRSTAAVSFQIDASSVAATTNIRCIRIGLSGMPRTSKGAC